MKTMPLKPRVGPPPLFWLILSIASFAAAFGAWQGQRIDRLRPPAGAAAPAAPQASTTEPAAAPTVPATAAPPLSASPTAAEAASEPVRQVDPQAGRQVLRCTLKGRVTYRDLNAGCPEGAAERVTVFPTEGVGRPR